MSEVGLRVVASMLRFCSLRILVHVCVCVSGGLEEHRIAKKRASLYLLLERIRNFGLGKLFPRHSVELSPQPRVNNLSDTILKL